MSKSGLEQAYRGCNRLLALAAIEIEADGWSQKWMPGGRWPPTMHSLLLAS